MREEKIQATGSLEEIGKDGVQTQVDGADRDDKPALYADARTEREWSFSEVERSPQYRPLSSQ